MTATRVIAVDRNCPEPGPIAEAVACVRGGGLVAFATETVYGLGADATRVDAIERIFAAKGRPSTNPLIVHVADLAMARQFAGSWCFDAEQLGQAGWPGPLTLVLPKTTAIPDIVTAGLPSVGLRVPAPVVARRLIAQAGTPLAAPSANRSEHVSPTTAQHVLEDLDGRIDLILDSGPTTMGIESAVVDLTCETPRVLRPGPVRIEDLESVVGRPFDRTAAPETGGPQRSPGQHARHYAPRTTCLRVDSLEALRALGLGERDAVLSMQADIDEIENTNAWIRLDDPTTAARELYATLRRLDTTDLDRIIVLMPPTIATWHAVIDRLLRATQPPAP